MPDSAGTILPMQALPTRSGWRSPLPGLALTTAQDRSISRSEVHHAAEFPIF